ncbi:MAG: DUF4040 domain-containing protein [Acidimicrobiales bacterium]|nr:DUF4040 domain-containing protein [Acidimicrobiales bacterium]
MVALLLLHVAVAAAASLAHRRLGARVFLVCAVAPLAAAVWAAAQAPEVTSGGVVTQSFVWVEQLGLTFAFRLDAFALLMVALVSGIGVLVFVYAAWYFDHTDRPGVGRFAATLTGFAGAMLGLVLSDNVFGLFVFWELTSITSFLLIGFDDAEPRARKAATQALLTTGAGGLALLGGLVLLSLATGTTSLSGMLAQPLAGPMAEVGLGLVLLGACTKSAQVPFHPWLPGAMAAPTPVSAYLHSATMVKAGVYLLARFAPVVSPETPWWRAAAVTVGLASMLVGGYRALRQHDVKLVLAYGTVAQLGLLFAVYGLGTPEAITAGCALLLAHALFKAPLFMVVGIVDHQAHTRDLRRLSGLGARMPAVFVTAALASASMAGIPLLLGFVAKEKSLDAWLHSGLPWGAPALGAIVVGSVLTVAYTARFLWGTFATKAPGELAGEPVGPGAARPRAAFVAPAAVLALLCLVLGVAPWLADGLVVDGARALDPESSATSLQAWYGVNPALWLSALALVGGLVLFAARRPVERLQAGVPHVGSAQGGYDAAVAGSLRGAGLLTGAVQHGSLPLYLAVALVTVVALPGAALLADTALPGGIEAGSWLQVSLVVILAVGAVATALARRRFAAVLLVGVVGYAVAGLFVVQGAPDLALTQLLIETLSVVIFVLVLRHLPERFSDRPFRSSQVLRGLVAVGVGLFMTLFALVALGARSGPTVSEQIDRLALPEGGGKNIVNVILVDIRGVDTMGEITVLTVTALGVIGLVRAGRRRGQAPQVPGDPAEDAP